MAKVLLVDDSSTQRKFIQKDIEGENSHHHVTTAANGEEALEKIGENDFDCIVTDLLMPIIDGEELLQKLHDENCPVPIIVITANSSQKKIEEIKELGARFVFNKPYESQELLAAISQLIQAKEVA